jgi:hypothetical protein
VGDGGEGRLAVTGAGSTLTAQWLSDWSQGSTGYAKVDITAGGAANVNQLRIGTLDGRALLNVDAGSPTPAGTLEVDGRIATRNVVLVIKNGGTLAAGGTASFLNQADVDLVGGTLTYQNNATFNAGTRLDWFSGNLSVVGQTLRVNCGNAQVHNTAGYKLSNFAVLDIRRSGTSAGTFNSKNYFDIGTVG